MRRLAQQRWIGFALVVVGMLLCPGPPYQDSTPELTAKYIAEATRCELFVLIGISLAVVGFVANRFVPMASVGRQSCLDRVYDRYFAK